MLKLYHARGVFQSSILCYNGQSLGKLMWCLGKQSKTGEWPCEHWLLATAVPSLLFQDWCEPLKKFHTLEHEPAIHGPRITPRPPSPPPHTHTPTPTLATGLTSPHQNVRWQNRKAAVCSHHLKVHLCTLPAKSISPPLSLPGQREGATETRDQHAHRLQLLLFFSDIVCLVCIF